MVEGRKVLSISNQRINAEHLHQQVCCPEQEPLNNTRNFHLLQAQNKALLASCINIQNLMRANREEQLQAKRQLSDNYRLLTSPSMAHNGAESRLSETRKIRQQLSDLDKAHVMLHQQFIDMQSRFRQTVNRQRSELMDSVSKARTRASMINNGNRFVSNMPDDESANSGNTVAEAMNVELTRKYA